MTRNPFAAGLLDASAPGFAALATERLLEEAPEAAARFGPDARSLWRENLLGRLRDLSVALTEGRPELFAAQLAWSRQAFQSRDLPVDVLVSSLTCLRQVLDAELPEAARDDVGRCLERATAGLTSPSDAAPAGLSVDTPRGRLAARYVATLLEGDRDGALALVLDAVDAGELDPREAVLDVCMPAQAELGRMWHLNEITVAEEHHVSATTVRLLAQLAAKGERAPRRGQRVLAAALEEDLHDIGLRAVCDVFERDGFDVVFLGSTVPVEDIVTAVDDFGADMVLLSATLPGHRRAVARAVAALRAAGRSTPVVVGGHAFLADPDGTATGADGQARSAEEALSLAHALLNGQRRDA